MSKEGESGAKHAKDAAAQFETRAGLALAALDYHTGEVGPGALRIVSMLVKAPDERRADYMVVIKAIGPEGPVVAFHGGETASGVVFGAMRRFAAGELSWREDRPWGS